MAGPGGGRRGSRRSSGGRSRSGGSHYHHRHHHHHGYYGSRRYNSVSWGGIIFYIFFLILLFVIIGGYDSVGNSEKTLHNYANAEYQTVFDHSNRYENNILFLYVVDDDYKTLDAIAWVGDDVPYKTNRRLDGYAISQHINENYYQYQLSSGIAMSLEEISPYIEPAKYSSTSICTVNNKSNLNIDEEKIEDALQKFSMYGYGVAVVIADYDDVYENYFDMNVMLALLLVGLVFCIVIFCVIRRKQKHTSSSDDTYNNSNNMYDNEY